MIEPRPQLQFSFTVDIGHREPSTSVAWISILKMSAVSIQFLRSTIGVVFRAQPISRPVNASGHVLPVV